MATLELLSGFRRPTSDVESTVVIILFVRNGNLLDCLLVTHCEGSAADEIRFEILASMLG